MKLNFFDRLRLRIQFLKFLHYTYRLYFPVRLQTFERWIILLPDDESKSIETLPLIYKIRKIYTQKISIFLPEKIIFMFKSFEQIISYESINYNIIRNLNSDILAEKTILIDFLDNVILKDYIVKKCLWISPHNYGNLILKGGINELYKFLGINPDKKVDYFKIIGIKRKRAKKYVLVDEKIGYFGSYLPIMLSELNSLEDMGFIKEIICSENSSLLIKIGELFNIPVKLRNEKD